MKQQNLKLNIHLRLLIKFLTQFFLAIFPLLFIILDHNYLALPHLIALGSFLHFSSIANRSKVPQLLPAILQTSFEMKINARSQRQIHNQDILGLPIENQAQGKPSLEKFMKLEKIRRAISLNELN